MRRQILHTLWCYMSGEAAEEIWNWSLLGGKGLTLQVALSARRECLWSSGYVRALDWGRYQDFMAPRAQMALPGVFVLIPIFSSFFFFGPFAFADAGVPSKVPRYSWRRYWEFCIIRAAKHAPGSGPGRHPVPSVDRGWKIWWWATRGRGTELRWYKAWSTITPDSVLAKHRVTPCGISFLYILNQTRQLHGITSILSRLISASSWMTFSFPCWLKFKPVSVKRSVARVFKPNLTQPPQASTRCGATSTEVQLYGYRFPSRVVRLCSRDWLLSRNINHLSISAAFILCREFHGCAQFHF